VSQGESSTISSGAVAKLWKTLEDDLAERIRVFSTCEKCGLSDCLLFVAPASLPAFLNLSVRGEASASPILLTDVGKLRFELIHFHLRVSHFLLLGLHFRFFSVDIGAAVFVSGVVGLAVVGL